MAVNAVNGESKLRLRLDGGVDGDGKEVIKSKTFSRIKADATNTDVYNSATLIAGLQTMPLMAVKRIDEVDLEEQL